MKQKEVAEKLGLSGAAVSNILRGKGRFSEETRKIVLETIEKGGIKPKFALRPVLCLQSRFHPVDSQSTLRGYEFFNGLRASLASAGIESRLDFVDIASSKSDALFSLVSKTIEAHKPSGILLDSTIPLRGRIAEKILDAGLGVIIFGHEYEVSGISTVMMDSFNGTCDAVRHLVSKGHRRIGIIRWNCADTPNSAKKFAAYQCVLSENGIEFDKRLVVQAETSNAELEDPHGQRPGRRAFETLMRQASPDVPTAVFVENSFVSPSLIFPMRQDRGLLPEIIRKTEFVHFADRDLLAPCQFLYGMLNYEQFPCTISHLDWEKMGTVAGDMMARMTRESDKAVRSVRLKPELKMLDSGKLSPIM